MFLDFDDFFGPLLQSQDNELVYDDISPNIVIGRIGPMMNITRNPRIIKPNVPDDINIDPQFTFAIEGVLLSIVAVFGLVGNILGIIVLSKPSMKSPINFILIGLGVSDSLFVLNRLIVVGLKNLVDTEDKYEFSYYIKLTWPIMVPFRYIFYSCSEYFTVLLTLERFIAICLPNIAHHVHSLKKTKIYIGCVVLFSFLINWPIFLKRSWGQDEQGKTEIIYYSGFSKEDVDRFTDIYETWFWIFINLILPLLCLIVFNILILIKMRQTHGDAALEISSPNSILRKNQVQERNMALMLMVIVSVFITCNIFSSILWVLFFKFREVCRFTISYLWSTSLLLETLNSSVNVIIYAIFNRKFRQLFVQLFCSCFKRESTAVTVRSSSRFPLGPLLYSSPTPSPISTTTTSASQHTSSREVIRFNF